MELDSDSTSKLKELYKKVQTSTRRELKIDPIYLPIDKPEFIQHFLASEVKLNQLDFIAPAIVRAIEERYTHLYLVGHKREGLEVRLWYFGAGPLTSGDKKRIRGILRRVETVRHLLPHERVSDHLTLYIFPTDFQKMMPRERGSPLGPEHCNTGATWIGRDEIAVWRQEEMEKVLIHELLHNYGADANIRDQSDLYLSEAFNEWLTTILYVAFRSAEKGARFPSFLKSLERQLEFSLKQSAKILYHYGQRADGLNANQAPFPQETHVYEYYIIKSALLYHLNLVLKYMDLRDLSFPHGKLFLQIVADSLDDGFIAHLNHILSQTIHFDRSLRMTL